MQNVFHMLMRVTPRKKADGTPTETVRDLLQFLLTQKTSALNTKDFQDGKTPLRI